MITTTVIFHVVSSAEYLQTWTIKPAWLKWDNMIWNLGELNLSIQLVSAMLLIEIWGEYVSFTSPQAEWSSRGLNGALGAQLQSSHRAETVKGFNTAFHPSHSHNTLTHKHRKLMGSTETRRRERNKWHESMCQDCSKILEHFILLWCGDAGAIN